MKIIPRFKETFLEGKNYKILLLSILVTGLSYGLYKGMLDNYLAEIVGLGEMERGVAEFFREIPGVVLVLILVAENTYPEYNFIVEFIKNVRQQTLCCCLFLRESTSQAEMLASQFGDAREL